MPKIYVKSVKRIAVLSLCIIMLTVGCAGPSYYGQAVSGHMRLMNQREDIHVILDSESTDPELAKELELTIQIREFAVTQLGLPDNGSYSQFVRTGQEAVTWNVVAAPEFSLAPKKWCFLGSGCVPYRGYFKQNDAAEFAGSMASRGYDTTVSPAIAYSTLGWFDDPLLDTMFQYSDEQLAAFIFHELAHQKLYVKGDTAFNEAYASFVEQAGVTRWLEHRGRAGQIPARQKFADAAVQLSALLQSSRKQLNKIYGSGKTEAVMRIEKAEAFTRLTLDYQAMVESQWEGRSYYENLFSSELNNASLALINTYQGGRCAFKSLYQQAERNMARFHELSAAKAELTGDAREAWLNRPCEAIASNGDL
jgi:predicted aminopeptidase